MISRMFVPVGGVPVGGVRVSGLVAAGLIAVVIMVGGGAVLAGEIQARQQGDEAWVHRDFAAAIHWYTKAAGAGDAAAQTRLGWFYRNGLGVARDYGAALNWFSLAARQGDAAGQFGLALLYQNGQGVRQNLAEAARWFRLSALQGHAMAQNDLGWAYQTGCGVNQDYAEAARWYRLAVLQGQRDAEGNLGLLLLNGQGVPRDPAEGERLLRLAAAQGDREAAAIVARLAADRPATSAGPAKPQTLYGRWRSTRPIRDEGLRQMYLVLEIRPDTLTFTYDCRFLDGSIVTGNFVTHAEITDNTIRIVEGGGSQATTAANQCAAAIKPATLPYRLIDGALAITFSDRAVVMLARAD